MRSRHQAVAHGSVDQRSRALFETATLDILRHRFRFGGVQVVQVANGYFAGPRHRRRAQVRVTQVGFDVTGDSHTMSGDQRGLLVPGVRRHRIRRCQ